MVSSMRNIKLVITLVITLLITGCATTINSKYQAVGESFICNGGDLGNIVVLPEAA